MLPPALQSSYKTYKEDTNTIANWLATKARQCGYSADLLNDDESSNSPKAIQASKRLKGKARKRAQKVRKATATPNPAAFTSVESPANVIKVKEFISLAEYIVDSLELSVELPIGIFRVLDRAIKLRRQFISAAGESTNPHEGHAYFLTILEKTRDTLKPYSAIESTAEEGLQKPSLEHGPVEAQIQEEVSNMFNNLDLEEPSQDFLDAPGVEPLPPKVKNEPPPRYESEIPGTREEECLAAHCLLTDIRNIRRLLCALWKNYQEGTDL
ncbi:MAG: hypothetical protein Q9169_007730 [Polycauliona sp. 2 TL-2023]